MGSLLTNQGALSSLVTGAFKMELDERNIGVGHNTMRLMVFFSECTDAVIKLIGWLDNRGGVQGFPYD